VQGYEALRTKQAWIDLSARGLIRLTGEDRARLLHAMTTNHVQDMRPGDCIYAFFLTAQGRILSDVWILCREDDFLLITEPETRQRVYDHLDQFIIADDVTLEDITNGKLALISIEGPQAGPQQIPLTYTGLPGGALLLPAEEVPARTAGLEQADLEAARVVRIENAHPRYGDEITERFLVQETGQMRAMHFSKGCYLGQEIVERVRSRGQVHRHLRGVQIEGTELPQPGTKLTSPIDGKDLAELVSAAYSPAMGKVVAMAYVRTDAAKPGFELRLSGTERPAFVTT
jgi:tRNA-modifying protein YgfZ